MTVAGMVMLAVACLLTGWYLADRRSRGRDDARVRTLVGVISGALTSTGDRARSDAVVRELTRMVGADSAAVGTVAGEHLEVFAMHGYEVGVRNHRLRMGEGCSGRAWQFGQPLVVPDVRRDPSYVAGNGTMRSGMYVPGRSDGRIVCVLAVESHRVQAYNDSHVRLVQPVADLLATMIDSRRVMREAEQLEERLLTLVSHEMRTPLTTILGTMSTLHQHEQRLDPQSRSDLLAAGLRGAHRMERLVEAVITTARLDAGDLRFMLGGVDVHQLLTDAVQTAGAAERTVILTEPGLSVVGDRSHLLTTLVALVENAVLHGGGTDVRLTASAVDASRVELAVIDHGAGIPAEDQQGMLGRFRRSLDFTRPGTGLGLYIAKRLVEAMGGELTLRTTRGGGCTVVLTMTRHGSVALADPGVLDGLPGPILLPSTHTGSAS